MILVQAICNIAKCAEQSAMEGAEVLEGHLARFCFRSYQQKFLTQFCLKQAVEHTELSTENYVEKG